MTQSHFFHDAGSVDVPHTLRPFVALPAPPSRPAVCTDSSFGSVCCMPRSLHLSEMTLAFEVSTDEMFVRLTLVSHRGTVDLGTRVHNYLLLTLARRRLRDLEDGLSERGSGWMDLDDWAHDDSFQPPQLNLYVHRIRKQFAARGIVDAYDVIERRSREKQIRVGLARARIERV